MIGSIKAFVERHEIWFVLTSLLLIADMYNGS